MHIQIFRLVITVLKQIILLLCIENLVKRRNDLLKSLIYNYKKNFRHRHFIDLQK